MTPNPEYIQCLSSIEKTTCVCHDLDVYMDNGSLLFREKILSHHCGYLQRLPTS